MLFRSFCDLSINKGVSDKHTTIRASWDGFEFATMRLGEVKPKELANGNVNGKDDSKEPKENNDL